MSQQTSKASQLNLRKPTMQLFDGFAVVNNRQRERRGFEHLWRPGSVGQIESTLSIRKGILTNTTATHRIDTPRFERPGRQIRYNPRNPISKVLEGFRACIVPDAWRS